MANPLFEPIIGSSFDNLASQRQFYQGFNNRVDESNLGRAAQAQKTRNDWLAQIAQLQQQDAARQAAAEKEALQLSLQQQADEEGRRRFGIDTDLKKEDMAIRRGDTAERAGHWQMNLDKQNEAERKALNETADYAETKAPQIKKAKDKFDLATQNFEEAQKNAKISLSQIEQDNPGAILDTRTQRFRPKDFTPASQAATSKAEEARQRLQADLADAQTEWGLHSKNYDALVKEAQGYGLTVLPDGSVHSTAHKKTWPETSGSGDTSDSKIAPYGWTPTTGGGFERPAFGPAPYAGFSAPSVTTPVTSTASTERLRIGRFSVIPQ